MTDLHRDNGGYTGIDVRDTADLWFDNVSLLLQPAAGDTVIEDKSPNAHSITNNGVTLDDTNQKWPGAPSMLFERANNDDLSLPDSDDWYYDTFDFTIEAFLYPVNIGTNEDFGVVRQKDNSNNDYAIAYAINKFDIGSNLLVRSGGTTVIDVNEGQDRTSPSNQWVHFSVIRSGDTISIFVDGTSVISGMSSAAVPDLGAALEIGRAPSDQYFDGNMTGLRITKGIARYTSAFTPPQRPFPTRRFVSGIIQP